MGFTQLFGLDSPLRLSQKFVYGAGTPLYTFARTFHGHQVHTSGLEHVQKNKPYLLVQLHLHHVMDAANLIEVFVRNGLLPPILTPGENVYRDKYAGPFFTTTDSIPVPRSKQSKKTIDVYQQVNQAQARGRSVWSASTNGLVKNGCIAMPESLIRHWHKASGYATIAELLERSPIIPITQNQSLYFGELLRAERDVHGKSSVFDRVMVREPFRMKNTLNRVIIGEPITTAVDAAHATARVNEFMAREYPVFPADLAAYSLRTGQVTSFPSDALDFEGHRDFGRQRRRFLDIQEEYGNDVYEAALQQRVGPLEAKLALLAPNASESSRTALLLDATRQTLQTFE